MHTTKNTYLWVMHTKHIILKESIYISPYSQIRCDYATLDRYLDKH